MSQSSATFIKGEKSPLYVNEAPSQGTAQFTSSPTFSLWDATGTQVLNAVSVSGYTTGQQASLQCYYNLDTSAITPGYFYGLFMMPFQAQDGISRVRGYDFDVYVFATPPF